MEAGDEDALISQDKRDDVEEIRNYRDALWTAVTSLDQLPLSQRLLKEAHAILLQGVRGRKKNPGQYRRIQNFIGAAGCNIETARFIPIAPNLLNEGMSQWEKFVHTDFLDVLVQLALVHAEFEALHPFQDGNGRLGRLIIPLFLFDKKLLTTPSFYMSEYLEANRTQYYDQLLDISAKGCWTEWCRFFLQALTIQAEENARKASAILTLYEQTKQLIVEQTRSQYAIQALDFIFQLPIFKSTDFSQRSNIPESSAKRILSQLRTHANLLSVIMPGKGNQPTVLAFRDLINIAEGQMLL